MTSLFPCPHCTARKVRCTNTPAALRPGWRLTRCETRHDWWHAVPDPNHEGT